jgi:cytochrome c oxidase subunit III
MAQPLSIQPTNVNEQPQEVLSMHPKKFLMWLFIVSIVMIFASMTSAYLVRKAEGNWLEFNLPPIFWYSTAVLALSSITMHISYWAAKKDNFSLLRIAISITFVLGLAFLYMQVEGWKQLVSINVYLVGNPSGSFVYVISGLHGAHIVMGLVILAFAFVAAWRLKIHGKALTQIQICATFWHFLDVLWIYLFLFLLYNN